MQLKAAAGNAGIVYVSTDSNITTNSVVATDGFPLSAGEPLFIAPSVFVQAGVAVDINNLYAAGDTNSQNIFVFVQ